MTADRRAAALQLQADVYALIDRAKQLGYGDAMPAELERPASPDYSEIRIGDFTRDPEHRDAFALVLASYGPDAMDAIDAFAEDCANARAAAGISLAERDDLTVDQLRKFLDSTPGTVSLDSALADPDTVALEAARTMDSPAGIAKTLAAHVGRAPHVPGATPIDMTNPRDADRAWEIVRSFADDLVDAEPGLRALATDRAAFESHARTLAATGHDLTMTLAGIAANHTAARRREEDAAAQAAFEAEQAAELTALAAAQEQDEQRKALARTLLNGA